jgi:predicted enzyme related to lactoylglutathione lyase
MPDGEVQELMMARIDYVELPSATAHELTRGFYAKAFGWSFTDYGPDYAATTTGDVDLGLNGEPVEALSAPLPVIRVADLDAAFERVGQAGGVIARPIYAFPGGRRFHFIDPGGSELAVWQSAEA